MKTQIVTILSFFILNGCSNKDKISMAANGEHVQTNNSKCPIPQLDGDTLHCYDNNGKYLGSLNSLETNLLDEYKNRK